MNEHLFKLKKDSKTVGYSHINNYGQLMFRFPDEADWWCINIFWSKMIDRYGFGICPCSYHPFVTKDKTGKDVFKGDEVLVYKGKKNIGEGYVDFNERFLWWVVNNSNQDNDRESPQDWSQLSLCDVDIELIEDKNDE